MPEIDLQFFLFFIYIFYEMSRERTRQIAIIDVYEVL